MAYPYGDGVEEPWHFRTDNVRRMILEALSTAQDAVPAGTGVFEVEILVAVNHLRHAAAELERSLLEQKYGANR